ncbi:MAG: FHA domain-containing protein, partial [Thermoanaerobaculia bacterium]|nr:FHA domain-containing protein [Thermoanaerobaculia bacterium]
MDLELIVTEGEEKGRTFEIPEGHKVTLGRSPDCDIQLLDAGVSRRHCEIHNTEDGVVIQDLDSANGTRVNGKAV